MAMTRVEPKPEPEPQPEEESDPWYMDEPKDVTIEVDPLVLYDGIKGV